MKREVLGVVIPIYNEEKVLPRFLDMLMEWATFTPENIIICFVDDGSDIPAKKSLLKCSEVTVKRYYLLLEQGRIMWHRHHLNAGVGAAVYAGIKILWQIYSGVLKALITLDADGQHKPEDIAVFVSAFNPNFSGIINGSRFLKKSQGVIPLKKRFFSFLASHINTLYTGNTLSDSQSGMKLFSSDVIEPLFFSKQGFSAYSYEWCSYVLWWAHFYRLKVKEVPIHAIYTPYSLSKGQNMWRGIITFYRLYSLRWRCNLYLLRSVLPD